MPDLTVVSFKWDGWRPLYNKDHVHAQQKMLAHYLQVPHRYVCVTDDPKGLNCETMPLWKEPIVTKKPTHHDSFCRLKMFSREMAEVFPGWVLMLDLDLLIFRDITDLITWEEFRILKGGVSPYNGSMWLHQMGTRQHIWDTFDPDKSPFEVSKHRTPKGKKWVGSDQGWISVCCPGERVYDAVDGVFRWSTMIRAYWTRPDKQYKVKGARMMFFAGVYKPWQDSMRKSHPDIYKEYMRWMSD